MRKDLMAIKMHIHIVCLLPLLFPRLHPVECDIYLRITGVIKTNLPILIFSICKIYASTCIIHTY